MDCLTQYPDSCDCCGRRRRIITSCYDWYGGILLGIPCEYQAVAEGWNSLEASGYESPVPQHENLGIGRG